MDRKITVDINNGRTMSLEQYKHDGGIRVTTHTGAIVDSAFSLSPGDLVTLINWYRYQKDNGNPNLRFDDADVLRCEKCGKMMDCVLVDMFDHNGADSYEKIQINPIEDAAVFEVSQNWTGYELSEGEQHETILCPHCKQFPFDDPEIDVYDSVQVICFRKRTATPSAETAWEAPK